MKAFYVNKDIGIDTAVLKKGELYLSTGELNKKFAENLLQHSKDNLGLIKSIIFCDTEEILRRAINEKKFKNLLLIRYGGFGDLIALTSIVDYYEDKNITFVTQNKYYPIFEWFENKPNLKHTLQPVFTGIKFKDRRFDKWAEFNGNGIVERGHKKNWFEVFFEASNIEDPGEEFYRPQLKKERINSKLSNIQKQGTGKPSILICNKATAMMRTIKASTIIDCIPDKEKYDIFIHENNIAPDEKVDAIIIGKTDFETFLLDCFDVDKMISVDTGSLHFREGVEKHAIGLYNSFTTDSRTKYYEHTKSFDIKSDCELQPCFLHERPGVKNCPKGNTFDAPCLNPEINLSLKEQLTEIFKNNL